MRGLLIAAIVLGLASPALAQPTSTPVDDEVPGAIAPHGPRGVHARALVSALGGAGLPVHTDGVRSFTFGGGLTTGIDVAGHPNHDVGLRVSYMAQAGGWEVHHWWVLGLAYRIHGGLRESELAPYFEIETAVGFYLGCLAGDYCGGLGPLVEIGAGAELPLGRFASLVFGLHLRTQLGLVNGVLALVEPLLVVGLRAG